MPKRLSRNPVHLGLGATAEVEMTLVHEIGGEQVRTTVGADEDAIHPPRVWHTADVERGVTPVFISPGVGTQGRPR